MDRDETIKLILALSDDVGGSDEEGTIHDKYGKMYEWYLKQLEHDSILNIDRGYDALISQSKINYLDAKDELPMLPLTNELKESELMNIIGNMDPKRESELTSFVIKFKYHPKADNIEDLKHGDVLYRYENSQATVQNNLFKKVEVTLQSRDELTAESTLINISFGISVLFTTGNHLERIVNFKDVSVNAMCEIVFIQDVAITDKIFKVIGETGDTMKFKTLSMECKKTLKGRIITNSANLNLLSPEEITQDVEYMIPTFRNDVIETTDMLVESLIEIKNIKILNNINTAQTYTCVFCESYIDDGSNFDEEAMDELVQKLQHEYNVTQYLSQHGSYVALKNVFETNAIEQAEIGDDITFLTLMEIAAAITSLQSKVSTYEDVTASGTSETIAYQLKGVSLSQLRVEDEEVLSMRDDGGRMHRNDVFMYTQAHDKYQKPGEITLKTVIDYIGDGAAETADIKVYDKDGVFVYINIEVIDSEYTIGTDSKIPFITHEGIYQDDPELTTRTTFVVRNEDWEHPYLKAQLLANNFIIKRVFIGKTGIMGFVPTSESNSIKIKMAYLGTEHIIEVTDGWKSAEVLTPDGKLFGMVSDVNIEIFRDSNIEWLTVWSKGIGTENPQTFNFSTLFSDDFNTNDRVTGDGMSGGIKFTSGRDNQKINYYVDVDVKVDRGALLKYLYLEKGLPSTVPGTDLKWSGFIDSDLTPNHAFGANISHIALTVEFNMSGKGLFPPFGFETGETFDDSITPLQNAILNIHTIIDTILDRLTKIEDQLEFLEKQVEQIIKQLNPGVGEQIAQALISMATELLTPIAVGLVIKAGALLLKGATAALVNIGSKVFRFSKAILAISKSTLSAKSLGEREVFGHMILKSLKLKKTQLLEGMERPFFSLKTKAGELAQHIDLSERVDVLSAIKLGGIPYEKLVNEEVSSLIKEKSKLVTDDIIPNVSVLTSDIVIFPKPIGRKLHDLGSKYNDGLEKLENGLTSTTMAPYHSYGMATDPYVKDGVARRIVTIFGVGEHSGTGNSRTGIGGIQFHQESAGLVNDVHVWKNLSFVESNVPRDIVKKTFKRTFPFYVGPSLNEDAMWTKLTNAATKRLHGSKVIASYVPDTSITESLTELIYFPPKWKYNLFSNNCQHFMQQFGTMMSTGTLPSSWDAEMSGLMQIVRVKKYQALVNESISYVNAHRSKYQPVLRNSVSKIHKEEVKSIPIPC